MIEERFLCFGRNDGGSDDGAFVKGWVGLNLNPAIWETIAGTGWRGLHRADMGRSVLRPYIFCGSAGGGVR